MKRGVWRYFLGFARDRKHRRTRLAVALLVLLSCATVRHVDEQQVRTIASQRLDCDEDLLKIQSAASPADGVARYDIDGCAHHEEYDCTEHGKVVSCVGSREYVARNTHTSTASSDETPTVTDYDTSGCNCGHLFDSHSSGGSTTPNQSVSPSTPAVNPQHR